jgi:hypothetical protein
LIEFAPYIAVAALLASALRGRCRLRRRSGHAAGGGLAFGVRDAIPILTVAQLIGNLSRVGLNRRELDWRVMQRFSLGAVPTAIAGGVLFAIAPAATLSPLSESTRTIPRAGGASPWARVLSLPGAQGRAELQCGPWAHRERECDIFAANVLMPQHWLAEM